MPGAVPSTRSPGKMQIRYLGQNNGRHTASFRIVAGEMPSDFTDADGLAADIAAAMQPLFSSTAAVIDGWALLDNDGTILAEGPIITPIEGSATPSGTALALSPTIAFLGVATGAALDEKVAVTKVTLFTGDTWEIPPAEPVLPMSAHAAWGDFQAFLAGHARIWADFYGRKARVREYVAVQYNAHVQRKFGA